MFIPGETWVRLKNKLARFLYGIVCNIIPEG
jgi:hypothetical protein